MPAAGRAPARDSAWCPESSSTCTSPSADGCPRLVAAVRGHPGHLGIGIDEDTAILVGSSRFDVLGRGAAVTVDVRPGSAIRQHTLRAGDAFDLEHRRPPEPLMDE
jgi:hypothetical protein